MRGGVLLLVGLSASMWAPSGPVQAAGPRQQSPAAVSAAVSPQRALLAQYCVTCHNDKLKTAGLTLDGMDVGNVSAHAAAWEAVVLKLRTRAMPPPGRPRPTEAAYDAAASWLETELDRAAAAAPNPGSQPAVRRLTR